AQLCTHTHYLCWSQSLPLTQQCNEPHTHTHTHTYLTHWCDKPHTHTDLIRARRGRQTILLLTVCTLSLPQTPTESILITTHTHTHTHTQVYSGGDMLILGPSETD